VYLFLFLAWEGFRKKKGNGFARDFHSKREGPVEITGKPYPTSDKTSLKVRRASKEMGRVSKRKLGGKVLIWTRVRTEPVYTENPQSVGWVACVKRTRKKIAREEGRSGWAAWSIR